jgi:hypothetical protein
LPVGTAQILHQPQVRVPGRGVGHGEQGERVVGGGDTVVRVDDAQRIGQPLRVVQGEQHGLVLDEAVHRTCGGRPGDELVDQRGRGVRLERLGAEEPLQPVLGAGHPGAVQRRAVAGRRRGDPDERGDTGVGRGRVGHAEGEPPALGRRGDVGPAQIQVASAQAVGRRGTQTEDHR